MLLKTLYSPVEIVATQEGHSSQARPIKNQGTGPQKGVTSDFKHISLHLCGTTVD